MNNTFTVLPMSQRFSLMEPGKTYRGAVTVVNPAEATSNFKYKVSVTPYGIIDKEYGATEDYESDLATETNRTQITKWIKITEPKGEVKPNETKEVEFTITVPEDAAGGGQYATIAVSMDDDSVDGESGVAVNNVFELASVIYASVNGKIKHGGEIIENNVPGFVTSSPVTLGAVISNSGNVHEDATFVIAISDFFTGRVILPTEEETGQYNELIMPETTRNIRREVGNLPALGVVKVKQTIYYRGEVDVKERNIIICPVWFIILALITLAAIVTTIVMIVKKYRKNRKAKKLTKATE